jgi:hypothetical protein
MYHTTSLSVTVEHDPALQLLEEIATLERRLDDMGLDGDCAYERAISRLYTGMVEDRKQKLAVLQRSSEY